MRNDLYSPLQGKDCVDVKCQMQQNTLLVSQEEMQWHIKVLPTIESIRKAKSEGSHLQLTRKVIRLVSVAELLIFLLPPQGNNSHKHCSIIHLCLCSVPVQVIPLHCTACFMTHHRPWRAILDCKHLFKCYIVILRKNEEDKTLFLVYTQQYTITSIVIQGESRRMQTWVNYTAGVVI